MRKKRVDTREERQEQEERTSGCTGTKRRGVNKRGGRSQAYERPAVCVDVNYIGGHGEQIAASSDAHGVAGEVIGSLSVSPSPSRAGIFKVDKARRSATGGGERERERWRATECSPTAKPNDGTSWEKRGKRENED
ncbi:hypothetical protein ALC60_00564 [Trachymyrmex zeteki]|uniref:Uncharacterized protein n=1 Tax=Mycetomoellerius zeteki TaxID=64791 RepID=A0A151XIP2_9HYME|nr:hypothetical protein ALC60_00564 [Trachymyrmex zeteki]